MKHLMTACKLAACAGMTTAVLAGATGTASATTVKAAIAKPVDATTQKPLPLPDGPNSEDFTFGFVLPAQASCPGDTAHDAYHIDTFIIPAGANPATTTYADGIPQVSGKAYTNLVTADEAPYTNIDTYETTGEIPVPLPNFQFAREFRAPTSNLITTGNYLAGFACVMSNGKTASYWDSFFSVVQAAKTTKFQKHSTVATSITPGTLDQGSSNKTITLKGFDFTGATLSVSGSGVTLSSVKVVSPGEITAVATVAKTAATGTRTVTVKAPAGTTTIGLKIAS